MYGDQFGEFVCGYCGLKGKQPAKLRRFSARLRESNGTTGFSSEKTFGHSFFFGRLLILFLLFQVTKKVSFHLSSVLLTENIEIRLRWGSS